jgi:hypothetical protein
MASVIRSIYSTLATKAVTVGGITPRVFDLDKLPNQVQRTELPCRLLLPLGPRGEAREFDFVAMGKTATMTWQVTDLMLWRAAGSGIGLEDIAETLVLYAAAYLEMLRQNRSMGQTQVHITGAKTTYGTFAYPDADTGPQFHGVACEITFQEYLSGA